MPDLSKELSHDERFLLSNVPPLFQPEDINRILKHVVSLGASDLHLAPNMRIIADIQGRFFPITRRKLVPQEVEGFIKRIYGDNATTQLNSSTDINCSHSIPEIESERRIRFRVNAVKILSEGRPGIQVTIRTIDSRPPTLESLKLEPEIWDNFRPKQGLIVVTGPTGSGKSTLLAGCIRGILEDPDAFKKIVAYEAPIEFTYDAVNWNNNMIFQTEVPTYLPNFLVGVETSMRRKPDVILIGESRDPETIRSSILASQTGHLVYTTAHTNGVAETIRRMINVFNAEEREALQYDLIESLRLVVSQRLIPSLDGRRIAIREFLVFTDELKDILLTKDSNLVVKALRDEVKSKGQSLRDDAIRKHEMKLISDVALKDALRDFR
jgi:defect-in-organelle-trafficking protein DotB